MFKRKHFRGLPTDNIRLFQYVKDRASLSAFLLLRHRYHRHRQHIAALICIAHRRERECVIINHNGFHGLIGLSKLLIISRA